MSKTKQSMAIEKLILSLHRMCYDENSPRLSNAVREALLDFDEAFAFDLSVLFTGVANQRLKDYLLLLNESESRKGIDDASRP